MGIEIGDAVIADGPPGTIIKRLGIKGFMMRDQFNYDYHMRFRNVRLSRDIWEYELHCDSELNPCRVARKLTSANHIRNPPGESFRVD